MMMEDLMIGDWVFDSTMGQNIRIEAICKEVRGLIDKAKPIPLTPEILMKNGIDIHTHCDMSKGLFFMGIKSEDGETLIRKRFIYVHELQHALRLCGLNKLADNFKV